MDHLSTLQMILLILLAAIAIIDGLTTSILASMPITIAVVAGIIVGDVKLGVTIGATLQLMVLGVGSYGGASVPDFTTGAIIGIAFAHSTGKGTEFALALAVPVGLLMVQLDVLGRFTNTFFQHRIDKNIQDLNTKAITRNVLLGMVPWGLSRALPVAIMLFFGQKIVDTIVNDLPDWLMGGLKVAGGLLPVVGIAILLRYLPTNKYIAYLIIGFVFASYLKVPMLGVAFIGAALAIIQFQRNANATPLVATTTQTQSLDGGYEDGEYEE
ncbi:PTS system, mannose-specific IIC component [Pilibacter termitis]|uniref:PTS system, mannose-specific IIC component n=1 Tax=Pilibacter termitis TaxID=263852 RepID=A0A1T4LL79_9ENTE|nr:PTS sugar transporter subunit IIC [Pilibacter termitis]SJZ55317.1 PTS system, mannose-specific IIC component [Pilibacter termitis]